MAVTGTLLRKILGHPEKPREQLPGQPVRSPARIPLAGTRRLGEEGRGNMGQFRWIPDVLGARDGGEGLQEALTEDLETDHRRGCSWAGGRLWS